MNGLSSTGPLIGGAVTAARSVPREFIRVIARVSGVTVRTLHTAILDSLATAIPNYRVVIATPEVRQGTLTLRGVTVWALHTAIPNYRVVIATPEIG